MNRTEINTVSNLSSRDSIGCCLSHFLFVCCLGSDRTFGVCRNHHIASRCILRSCDDDSETPTSIMRTCQWLSSICLFLLIWQLPSFQSQSPLSQPGYSSSLLDNYPVHHLAVLMKPVNRMIMGREERLIGLLRSAESFEPGIHHPGEFKFWPAVVR